MTSSALSGYSKIYKQGLVQVQASYATTELWRGNDINATQTSVINAVTTISAELRLVQLLAVK